MVALTEKPTDPVKVFEANIGLAIFMLNRWRRRIPASGLDDARQVALTALFAAVREWPLKPRTIQFTTFAGIRVNWAMQRWIKEECRRGFTSTNDTVTTPAPPPRVFSLNKRLSRARGKANELGDIVAAPQAVEPDRWNEATWDRVLRVLDPRRREVVLLYYRDGLDSTDICSRFGVSSNYIRMLHVSALRMLLERVELPAVG